MAVSSKCKGSYHINCKVYSKNNIVYLKKKIIVTVNFMFVIYVVKMAILKLAV